MEKVENSVTISFIQTESREGRRRTCGPSPLAVAGQVRMEKVENFSVVDFIQTGSWEVAPARS
jgi:hypothetical protein